MPPTAVPSATGAPAGHRNEVVLHGRVSAPAEARDLPSGDHVVTLRLVVDRAPTPDAGRRVVDVIDVACWSARTRRSALALQAGALVEVEGALRRRFFATGAGRASRYEVEARRLVRLRTRAAT